MLRTFFVLSVSLALAACANQGRVRERELTRIGDWLPGQYNNTAQVDEELQKAVANPHPPVEVTILPILAPFIGEMVLFVQTIDTSGRRHIVSEQLYRFDKTPDGKGIVQRVFDFKEPQRWTRGGERPDIFKSLVADDITATPACDLGWVMEKDTFKGTAGRKGCGIRRMSFDGVELNIEQAGRPAGDVLQLRRIGAE